MAASVYETREAIGRELANKEFPPSTRIFLPVPDSGTPAASGLASEVGIPMRWGAYATNTWPASIERPKQIRTWRALANVNGR